MRDPGPMGLMFHHFHGPGHPPGQGSISAEQMHSLLAGLGTARFTPAGEWRRRAVAGALAHDELCVTFDDTLACQFQIALPVLERLGLTGFWFITTKVLRGTPLKLEVYRAFRTRCFREIDDFYEAFFRYLATCDLADAVQEKLASFDPGAYLTEFPFYTEADRRFRYVRDVALGPAHYERLMDAMILATGARPEELAEGLWLTPAQVRELHARGHVVGLHSHSHPTRMAELDPAAQRREYRDNLTELTALLGERPSTMAHPCNSYSPVTLGILRELGIELGFRANTRLHPHGPLEFPRLDHTLAIEELHRCGSPF